MPYLTHRQWFVIVLVALVCVTALGVVLVIAGQGRGARGLGDWATSLCPWGLSALTRYLGHVAIDAVRKGLVK